MKADISRRKAAGCEPPHVRKRTRPVFLLSTCRLNRTRQEE